jgi:hypothetical protein
MNFLSLGDAGWVALVSTITDLPLRNYLFSYVKTIVHVI